MFKSKLLITTALATGLLITGVAAPLVVGFANVAVAAEGSGDGSGDGAGSGSGGQGGQGGSGSHDDADHDDSDHDDSDHESGGGNSAGQHGQDNQGGGDGQTGPDDSSEGVGPQAGSPSHDDGGQPAWAQEGIPEIELGRLNVARSPEKVLDQAYDEALLALPASADFYNLPLEDIKDALANDWDNLTLVDSPLSNLALLKDAMDGEIDLSSVGITNDAFTLAAVFLGVASDKTVPITEETVIALSVIYDIPVSDAYVATLAYHAEEIREAVLEGHG